MKILTQTKIAVLLLSVVLLFPKCTPEDTIIPPDPIEDKYSEATFNFNFDELDTKLERTFNAYMQTYESTVVQEKWKYNNEYSLKNLNLILFTYDSDAKNLNAAYAVVTPISGFTGDVSNVVSTSNTASDETKIIRITDEDFLKKLIKARLNGGDFGISTLNEVDYFYYFLAKNEYNQQEPLDIFRNVGAFIHEGFHQTAQLGYTRPDDELKSIRFNLPSEYPADSVSFSLIAAGIKLYEDILFEENVNYSEYAKMYYVLFKKMKELDTTGKNYIDKFYLFECWLEGSAEFTEYNMLLESNLMDKNIPEIRYDNSFQEFKDIITSEIDAGVTPTTIYNGQETIIYYDSVVESTYYKLGSATLFLLDHLEGDIFSKIKVGKNPYEMLEEYINSNNISIDENEIYNNLKSQIDWDETKVMMQNYINLFNN